MAKTSGKPSRAAGGRIIIAILGTGFFTVAAGVLAYHAVRAQQPGIPITDGHGGVMTPGKAYGFAALLLVLAGIYGWRVKQLLRPRIA